MKRDCLRLADRAGVDWLGQHWRVYGEVTNKCSQPMNQQPHRNAGNSPHRFEEAVLALKVFLLLRPGASV
jgi:hypothetical protein